MTIVCDICEYQCGCFMQFLADWSGCNRFKPEKTKQTALNVQQGSEGFD